MSARKSKADTNIRVHVRVRPLKQNELDLGGGEIEIKYTDGNTVSFSSSTVPGGSAESKPGHVKRASAAGGHDGTQEQAFTFDSVFGTDSTQEEVYLAIAEAQVTNVLEGYNATLFAYGQTGSGKTWSMFGKDMHDEELAGIIPRAVKSIFTAIQQAPAEIEMLCRCAFLEVYNETVRDLLNPVIASGFPGASAGGGLRVRETPSKGVWVEGLTEQDVESVEDVMDLIAAGEKVRKIASTNMNEMSSRSHSLLQISLEQQMGNGSTKSSKMNLVDLAGSEKIAKTGAQGETLEEAKKINQSLSCLALCINSLSEKRSHVPYRDSKLTFLLKESLGGNTKTTLLIAASPALMNIDETISSLRFGKACRSIITKAKVNVQKSVAELEFLVETLQKQLQKGGGGGGGDGMPMVASPEQLVDDASASSELAEVRALLADRDVDVKGLENDLKSKHAALLRINDSLGEMHNELKQHRSTVNNVSDQSKHLKTALEVGTPLMDGWKTILDNQKSAQHELKNVKDALDNSHSDSKEFIHAGEDLGKQIQTMLETRTSSSLPGEPDSTCTSCGIDWNASAPLLHSVQGMLSKQAGMLDKRKAVFEEMSTSLQPLLDANTSVHTLLNAMATFVSERMAAEGSVGSDGAFTVTHEMIHDLIDNPLLDRPPGLDPANNPSMANGANGMLDAAPLVLKRSTPSRCQNCEAAAPSWLCVSCPEEESFFCSGCFDTLHQSSKKRGHSKTQLAGDADAEMKALKDRMLQTASFQKLQLLAFQTESVQLASERDDVLAQLEKSGKEKDGLKSLVEAQKAIIESTRNILARRRVSRLQGGPVKPGRSVSMIHLFRASADLNPAIESPRFQGLMDINPAGDAPAGFASPLGIGGSSSSSGQIPGDASPAQPSFSDTLKSEAAKVQAAAPSNEKAGTVVGSVESVQELTQKMVEAAAPMIMDIEITEEEEQEQACEYDGFVKIPTDLNSGLWLATCSVYVWVLYSDKMGRSARQGRQNNGPITNLAIATTPEESGVLQAKGYSRVSTDLNSGNMGTTQYLWYKKDRAARPLTDLIVPPSGTDDAFLAQQHYVKLDNNLNAGNAGDDLFLYSRKAALTMGDFKVDTKKQDGKVVLRV